MSNEMDLKHRDAWKGDHRSIRYEIVRWVPSADREPTWNYYLYVPMAQVPADKHDLFNLPPEPPTKNGRITYDYMSAPVVSDLDWHGGITFYDKHGGIDGQPLVIQIGCDYSHLWDEGQRYDERYVQRDAIASIEKLWELVPDLLLRCSWNGGFYPQADGVIADGVFTSSEGVAQREGFRKECEQRKAESAARA